MKIPETGKIIPILYIGAALIGVYLVYKIFAGVGIIKTAAKKKEIKSRTEAETKLRSSEYFNPLFLKGRLEIYKNKLGNQAKDYAAQLRKAIAGLGTNEETIFSIFGRLHNKWNIGEISMYYRGSFNRDLLSDLLNDLTDKEQLTLWELINKLPENS